MDSGVRQLIEMKITTASVYLRRFIVGCLLFGSPIFLEATTASEVFSEEQRAYWVFQPISKPAIPKVRNADWVRNPIDAFILDHIEAQSITPTPEANRRTLIRRATLDLLGVPPTAQQIDDFINDPAPDAYEKRPPMQLPRLLCPSCLALISGNATDVVTICMLDHNGP